MPNSKAKSRKRKKRLLNDKLRKEGRTAAQRDRIKRKLKRKEIGVNGWLKIEILKDLWNLGNVKAW